LLQVCPALHTLPQEPQLFASLAVLTQALLQNVCPEVEQAQAPFTHARPPLHTVPHAPQFAESEAVVTHCPEHAVCPLGH
jgi:hypothetical protein